MYEKFTTCRHNNSRLTKLFGLCRWSFLLFNFAARNKWPTQAKPLAEMVDAHRTERLQLLKYCWKFAYKKNFQRLKETDEKKRLFDLAWNLWNLKFSSAEGNSENIQSGCPCWVQRLISEFRLWHLKLFVRIKSLSDVTFCWLRNWTPANFTSIFLWYCLPFRVSKHEFR